MSKLTIPLHERVSVSVNDAATMLGLSRVPVYDLLRAGELKSYKLGSRRLVDVQSIKDLVSRRANTQYEAN